MSFSPTSPFSPTSGPPRPRTRSRVGRYPRCRLTLTLALLAALAISLVGGRAAAPAFAARPAQARVAITAVHAVNTTVTVKGRVALPATLKNTPATRSRVRVVLALVNAAGKKQTFTAKITRARTFLASKATTFTGRLRLTALVKIGGRVRSKTVVRKHAVTVTPAAVAITKIVGGPAAKVTITGRVALPGGVTNTPANRGKVTVALALVNTAGKRESFTAKITGARTFTAAHTTKLTGKLNLTALVRFAGKLSGKTITRKNAITVHLAAASITSVTAKSTSVTISGKVTLPSWLSNTAANRATVRLALALTDPSGKKESFTAAVNASLGFTATHTTALAGGLSASAQVLIAGKASGTAASRLNAVTIIPDDAVQLNGLFGFDPGQQAADGTLSGTYFRMALPDQSGFLVNDGSTAGDKTYTLLSPGTDGGLRTDEYQPPPDPPFATPNPSFPDGSTGNALASQITQPQTFYGVDFGISTKATDDQARTVFGQTVADPLPQIFQKDGKLFGQITDWTADWNGGYFNQGSPKPDGTPASYPATAVTGTYDAVTHHYTLTWTSRIYGGPFQGYWGYWYLAGTFTPADELPAG